VKDVTVTMKRNSRLVALDAKATNGRARSRHLAQSGTRIINAEARVQAMHSA
jgi:hypothetical protein